MGVDEEEERALGREHGRVVQPDQADVGAHLEGPVEPHAGEAAGQHVEVARVVVIEPVVQAEGDGERDGIQQQDGGEEDGDRERESAPRPLQLTCERAEREEAAVQPQDPRDQQRPVHLCAAAA